MAGTRQHQGQQVERDPTGGARSEASARGTHEPAYEDWKRDDLYVKAKQAGIEGRSRMSKKELIAALRSR